MANVTVKLQDEFQNWLKNATNPEIASSWEDFVKYVKDFRTHMFWGGVAATGVGLFTTLYALGKLEGQSQFALGTAGVIATLLGTGMTVDMVAHLYMG